MKRKRITHTKQSVVILFGHLYTEYLHDLLQKWWVIRNSLAIIRAEAQEHKRARFYIQNFKSFPRRHTRTDPRGGKRFVRGMTY